MAAATTAVGPREPPLRPYLHGEDSTQAQVSATWRSVPRRDGPEPAPDRSLATSASEPAAARLTACGRLGLVRGARCGARVQDERGVRSHRRYQEQEERC